MSDFEVTVSGDTEINLTVTPETAQDVSIVGIQGPQGPQGPAGADGMDGIDGVSAIPNGGTTGQILRKLSDTSGDADWTDETVPTGNPNRVAWFNGIGGLEDISRWEITSEGYFLSNPDVEPRGLSQSTDVNRFNSNIRPSQDSPDETVHLFNNYVVFDPDDSGFSLGDSGQAFRFFINGFNHEGSGNIGATEFIQNNFTFGNGTDPIEVRGFGYMLGFGSIRSGVKLVGPSQGYGFQPHYESGSSFDVTNSYVQGFYDNADVDTVSQGHTSFNASPTIEEVASNRNYTGLSVYANVDTLHPSAGVIGVSVGTNVGTMGEQSYWQGVNVNPNITSGRSVTGLNVSMDNVNLYAGVAASLTQGDLTIAADLPSSYANNITFQFVGGGTAGSEVVSGSVPNFQVQIEDGVSTATQIAAALNASVGFTQNFNVTVSGTGSNPQSVFGPTNLSGGEDPGRKLAAYLDGDVEITGSLTFGGALSIGKLNSFYQQEIVDGGGSPSSIHGLISSPTIAANTTVANGDTLGINTAMLLTMGDNSHVTTSFVGMSALALPAVVEMGSGSTIDQVAGATFAVSLSGTSTGGTMSNMDLCRSLAIPNGVTAITNLRGYKFELPFGDPGANTWGFYASTGHNYFAGDLKIGIGSDVVANGSIGLELEDKFMVIGRGTTVARDAKTAIDGAIWYNTTTNTFQGYASGAWVDFH